jgi:hypothetical protein
MSIFNKVWDNSNICGIELAFNGEIIASNIPEWQPFFNSAILNVDFEKIYFGFATVEYNEESSISNAGVSYKQKLMIRFPSTDHKRAERIDLLHRVKFLKIKLSNGKDIVIGRNDYLQNARPKVSIKTNHKTAEASFETISIMPSGFVPNPDSYLLPSFIPLTLN